MATYKHKTRTAGGAAATPVADTGAPPITDWDDGIALPSLLVSGESGGGKTTVIARLLEMGLNGLITVVEPKVFVLKKYRPALVDITAPVAAGQAADTRTRYDRLMRFADALAGGAYREHNGRPIQFIAFDSLMELSDLIHAQLKSMYTREKTLVMWEEVSLKAIAFIKMLRDAAGQASSRFGLPPVAIVATVGTEIVEVGGMPRNEYALAGKKTGKRLAYQFEVAWHMAAGVGAGGEHEFRVFTQRDDSQGIIAKTPAGIFPAVVSGPGFNSPTGEPDPGRMYLRLLSDESSPYYSPEVVATLPPAARGAGEE